MKRILRPLTFSIVSLGITQYLIGGFDFGSNAILSVSLIVIAFSLLLMFLRPLLGLISLPTAGVIYVLILILMSSIIFYVLTVFIPGYALLESTLPQFTLFGIVLPSKVISPASSALYSGLVFGIFSNYLSWLTEKKK
jgi:hypothetical protein